MLSEKNVTYFNPLSFKATSQPHQGQVGFGGGGDPRVHVVWARFEVSD